MPRARDLQRTRSAVREATTSRSTSLATNESSSAREADRSANVHRFDLALADESVQCCAADAEQVSSLLSGERRRDSASCSDCLRRLASGSWVLRYIVKKLAGEGRGHPDAGYLKERAEDWVPAQYNPQSYKEKRRHYFIEG